MMRGICHWFYQRNLNDLDLQYCRHGSTCRFKHLTQEEVETLQQRGNDPVQCPTCSGSGQIFVRNLNLTMPCLYCYGKKEVTVKKTILNKCENREWCRCKESNPRNTIYFPDGTHPKCRKHCYVCRKCKGITQTG